MTIGCLHVNTIMPEADPVATQQPHDAQTTKLKKIEWYAGHLVNEAASKEKAGRIGDAIADYLQAADLLLLLARGQQDYSPWKSLSDRAMSCQQRARVLIAARKQTADDTSSGP
jgi:hypothetical protein